VGELVFSELSDWIFLLAGVVVIMLVALLVVMLWH
jgi:hypothetical protein